MIDEERRIKQIAHHYLPRFVRSELVHQVVDVLAAHPARPAEHDSRSLLDRGTKLVSPDPLRNGFRNIAAPAPSAGDAVDFRQQRGRYRQVGTCKWFVG